jgi:hypothetical protein
MILQILGYATAISGFAIAVALLHRENNAFLAILDEVNRQVPEDKKFRPSQPYQICVSSLGVPAVLRAHRAPEV